MKETDAEKIKRLQKLVKAQKELLRNIRNYFACCPFCIDEVVQDYRELEEKIEELE